MNLRETRPWTGTSERRVLLAARRRNLACRRNLARERSVDILRVVEDAGVGAGEWRLGAVRLLTRACIWTPVRAEHNVALADAHADRQIVPRLRYPSPRETAHRLFGKLRKLPRQLLLLFRQGQLLLLFRFCVIIFLDLNWQGKRGRGREW